MNPRSTLIGMTLAAAWSAAPPGAAPAVPSAAASGAPTPASGPVDTLSALSTCPAAVPFPAGIDVVKAIKVYKTAAGESAFQQVEFKGESKAYFKPGEMFAHTLLANAGKVQIISGPSGRTGPCGYVAINIVFPDSANDP